MSRLDEPVDRGAVLLSARMTVEVHEANEKRERQRPCHIECPRTRDCRQLEWARHQLANQTTPASRPAA